MTTPHGDTAGGSPYGLGFWLALNTDAVGLEGSDAGISFIALATLTGLLGVRV